MIQSAEFWVTAALTAVIVWQLPVRWRNGFVALVSMGFVAWLAPKSMLLLCAWGIAFFYLVRPPAMGDAPRRRSFHAPLILGVLGMLGWYKYWPTLEEAIASNATENVIVPLGMSYFTFKLIHYAVEVAKGNIRERRLTSFFCYLFLFPIFSAGPIERFDHFIANREERWTLDTTVNGLMRIIHGLAKKIVVADLIILEQLRGRNATSILEALDQLSQWEVASFLFLYFLYIYFDFSAYSDICIGVSLLFGLRVMENFNFPLFARDINDFWKRWHMSLSGWCQAYVYLPTIGLTRNPYLAIVSTFVVMGLWHTGSLTRICWGLYQAAGVILFTKWSQLKRKRKWKALNRAPYNLAGTPITLAFLTGSTAFLAAEASSEGVSGALRILAKFFFIDVTS